MKYFWICCAAVLCIILSGCAGISRETAKAEPPEQIDTNAEVPDKGPEAAPPAEAPASPAEPESSPEDDPFLGRWQAAENPQYYMDISGGGEDGYTIEITFADDTKGNTVWQVSGAYDEIWEGVAYTGAKYEDTVNADGTVTRTPVLEREEISGMVFIEDGGILRWIDDFDHAGDDLSFERE